MQSYPSPATLEAGAASGAILETWIFSEVLKSWWHHGRRAPFCFYRDKDQKEVDLLIVQDDVIYPLECRKSASPGSDAASNIRTLAKLDRSVGPGGLICLVSSSLPLCRNVVTIPVGAV